MLKYSCASSWVLLGPTGHPVQANLMLTNAEEFGLDDASIASVEAEWRLLALYVRS